jgi:hypothetical protein
MRFYSHTDSNAHSHAGFNPNTCSHTAFTGKHAIGFLRPGIDGGCARIVPYSDNSHQRHTVIPHFKEEKQQKKPQKVKE